MKFERLEAVRGFAAIYVCIGHIVLANPSLNSIHTGFRFGQEAVMVFFVLSGFVISWATSRPNVPQERFGRYFLKRFARIYSAWALALLACMAMTSFAKGTFIGEPVSRLAGNALMLQDFATGKPAVICTPFYGNEPLWSLHYEWWFYMLFPVVMNIQSWQKRMHAVGTAAVANGILYVVLPNPVSRLLLYFGVWWIGSHAATCLRRQGRITFRDLAIPMAYVTASSVPLILLSIASYQHGVRLSPGIHPILEARHLLGAVVLTSAAFLWRRWRWIGFRQTIGLFAFIAPISFSLYIIHYNSIVHARYLAFLNAPVFEFVTYTVVTVLFCIFAELYVYPRIRRYLLPTQDRRQTAAQDSLANGSRDPAQNSP